MTTPEIDLLYKLGDMFHSYARLKWDEIHSTDLMSKLAREARAEADEAFDASRIAAMADDGITLITLDEIEREARALADDEYEYSHRRAVADESEVHDTLRPEAPDTDEVISKQFEVAHLDTELVECAAAQSGDDLTARVLSALRSATSPRTVGELAKVVGLEAKVLSGPLKRLVAGGFVERSGEKRGTRYVAIVDKEAAE